MTLVTMVLIVLALIVVRKCSATIVRRLTRGTAGRRIDTLG